MDFKPLSVIARIDRFDEKPDKIVVFSGSESYSFFKQKKDGTESAAYRTFQKYDVTSGNPILINYTVNGRWKNVVSFDMTNSGQEAPKPVARREDFMPIVTGTIPSTDSELLRQERIMRGNALNAAAAACAGKPEDVLNYAERFLGWLKNDMKEAYPLGDLPF